MKKYIYNITLTILVLTIGFSGCIQKEKNENVVDTHAHINNTPLSSSNIIKDKDSNLIGNDSGYYGKTTDDCQFNLISERTIIIRMDDVQAYAWNKVVINLTDAVLSRNMSITLGIIPRNIGNDAVIKGYLISKLKNPKIEIAQHGVNHTANEYLNLSESYTYNLTKMGIEDIIDTLDIRPITFIPPYNEYNKNTTVALSKLNFKIFSASRGEYKFDGSIMHIGYDGITKNATGLVPINDILKSCRTAVSQKNVCVILVHPQDYVKDDGKTLDDIKYKEFIKLLDELKRLNTRFSTFKDLIICR